MGTKRNDILYQARRAVLHHVSKATGKGKGRRAASGDAKRQAATAELAEWLGELEGLTEFDVAEALVQAAHRLCKVEEGLPLETGGDDQGGK